MISSEFGPVIDVTHGPNATLPIRFLNISIAAGFPPGGNGRMGSVRFAPGTCRQLVIWQLKTLRKVLKEIFAKPGFPASFTKMITASRLPAPAVSLAVGSA